MRFISVIILVLATCGLVDGQSTDAPADEEVLRQVPQHPHALDFIQTALPIWIPSVGDLASGASGPVLRIVVWAIIGADGRVKEAKIKQSGTAEIDNAILQTVTNRWQFEPAQYQGQPVAVQINIELVLPH